MYKNVIYMHSIAVKDNHPNKIDATIGVLLDDDKNFNILLKNKRSI